MSLPIFRQRNQSIKAEFNLLLRSQMPTMLIYAKIAAEYGISEDRTNNLPKNVVLLHRISKRAEIANKHVNR